MSFWRRLAEYGDAVALIDQTGRVTYAELGEAADRRVAHLPPRSLVAVECVNNRASIEAYLGALRAGHVALLVPQELHDELRCRLYSSFGVEHVFSGAGAAWSSTGCRAHTLDPALALLLSTSGSTGEPKLVKLSAANLEANARSIAEFLAITSAERAIMALPIHYSFGLSVLHSHLLASASLVLTERTVMQGEFWSSMRDLGVTSLAGVPASYAMLRRLRVDRMTLPQLRTLTVAGGKLDTDSIRWFAEWAQRSGRRFFVMYGQTEATARIAYVPHERATEKAGSIGQAIPGGRLWLRDAQGQRIDADGVVGELVYVGDNVMLGYAQSADDLAASLPRADLATGDLAWRDEDGFYWIAGRIKRFIKIFGMRISLDEVESWLRADDLDAAVVGQDDRLVIALAGAAGAPDSTIIADLRARVCARYRIHPSVVQVCAVDEIPLTASGKIRYADLSIRLGVSAAERAT